MTIYETSSDIDNEVRAIPKIEAKLNCRAQRLKKLSNCDYAFTRDNVLVAMGEFKKRSVSKSAYKSYMLSASKYANILVIAKALDVPALLIVEWTDETGYLTLGSKTPKAGVGGRKDRGDVSDTEIVVYFPIEDFIKL